MHEVTIILQVISTKKPKYAEEILRQVYILNTNIATLKLWNAYINNALMNIS